MPIRVRALAILAFLLLSALPLAPAHIPEDPYEAEQFPVRTNGGRVASSKASGGGYWNLWTNGHVEAPFYFHENGTASISVRAKGNPLGGKNAIMAVEIDGERVHQGSVSRSFRWYTSTPMLLGPGIHTVRVVYTNDARSSHGDRNLHVDVVRFLPADPGEGTPPGPPPASPPPGTAIEAESFAKRSGGRRDSAREASGGAAWKFATNGHLEETFLGDGRSSLLVVARGTPARGDWPRMEIRVDGALAGVHAVASTIFTTYAGPVLAEGPRTVRISFTNDLKWGSENRDLHVDVVRLAAAPRDASLPGSAFTLAAGQSRDVAFEWGGGRGWLVANAATPPAPNDGPVATVAIPGAGETARRLAGPVARPIVLEFNLPAGAHKASVHAAGGRLVVESIEVRNAALPLTVPAAAARVRTSGYPDATGWWLAGAGLLDAPLVVPETGWYELRALGSAETGEYAPLVHLLLNRTVVAEGVQGAVVDLRARVLLHAGVGYSLGASFENPSGGSRVRFDALSATPSGAPPPRPPPSAWTVAPAVEDWPQEGRDLWNTRTSPDPTLPTAANASALSLRWRTRVDGSVTGTPAVVGNVLYFGTWAGSVYALEERDGSIRWNVSVGSPVYSSPAVAGGLVLVGTSDGRLVALEEETGAIAWSSRFGGTLFGSPVVDGDDVFVGVDSDRGYVARVALATGAVIWKSPTTDIARGGARIWQTLLVPPGTDRIVAGTSPGTKTAIPPTSDAVVAFERGTGRLAWSHQLYPGDRNEETVNRDFGSTPVFHVLDGRPVAIAPQKGEAIWIVDVADGAVVRGGRLLEFLAKPIGAGARLGDLYLVTSTEPNRIAAFDLRTGDLLWEAALPSTAFGPVSIGGSLAWTGSWKGYVHAFDLGTGREVARLDAAGGVFGGVALAHGRLYAGASDRPDDTGGSWWSSLGILPGSMSSWGGPAT